ncbi:MAG: autotransporter-associated beta strand repeat-containing protein [Azoarcus sp.]|nr:autotransporter-associated beta strand repeat-containing protein [Azoarcus sp.]
MQADRPSSSGRSSGRPKPLALALLALFAAPPAFADCTYTNATSGAVSSITRYGDSNSTACTDSNLASSSNTLTVVAPLATFNSSNFYGATGVRSNQANYNTVIFMGSLGNSSVFGGVGGEGGAAATYNAVVFNGSITGAGNVYGARGGVGLRNTNNAGGSATYNTVVFNGSITGSGTGNVYGALGGNDDVFSGAGAANYNTVFFNASIAGTGNIYGGYGGNSTGSTNAGAANYNTVVFDGSITGTGNVYGGRGGNNNNGGSANYNTVILNDSFSGNVYGGYGGTGGAGGGASNNNVIIGGTIAGNVFGGYGSGAASAATGNTVTIDAQASSFGTVNLRGGLNTGTTNVFTGNTLNFKTSGFTAAEVKNFQILNFTLPGNISTSTPMLEVGSLVYGGTGVSFNIFTPGSSFLDENVLGDDAGKTYTLLHAGGQPALNATSVGYSLYGQNFTCGSADSCDPINLGSGRVQGSFTLTLENGEDLKLEVKDYDAPNKVLTWTGSGSATWSNYNAATPVNNWSDGSAIAYLDGDTVSFGNTGAGTVTIDKMGVTPADVIFDSSGNYTLVGLVSNTSGALSGDTSLTKNGTGKLTLTGTNLYTGGTIVYDGILSIASDLSLGTPGAGKQNLLSGGTLELTGTAYARNWTLDAGKTHTINVATSGSASATFAGQLSGAGGLIKTGTNTLVLAGDNTYAGDTTISAGSLRVTGTLGHAGGGNDYADDIIVSASSSTLSFLQGVDQTISGVISGAGALIKAGTGTLTLTGTNTYGGGTTINAGLIGFYSATDNFGTANITLNGGGLKWSTGVADDISGQLNAIGPNGGIFDTNANDVTLADALTGTGGITKQGAGILTLSGANTYSGNTAVTTGTLTVTGTLGSGAYAGTIANAGTLIFNQSEDQTLSGVISGAGSLAKTGAGTLTLTNANTYTGGTTVSGGSLQIGTGSTTGNIAGNIANNANVTFNRSDALTYAGAISGSGSLTKAGGGTLTLTGSNTYGGATTVTDGTLAGNIAANTNLTVDAGATYSGNGAARTINVLSGAGTVTSNNSLTVQSGAFSGAVAGTASLTKAGSGMLTLTGTNAYTGNTTVTAGTLEVTGTLGGGAYAGTIANAGALIFNQSAAQTLSGNISGVGALTKSGNGTLTLTGTNTYSGATTVNEGSLQIGNGGTTGSLTGNIANNANVTFNRSNALTYGGGITGTGNLTKTGAGTLALSGTNTYTGNTTVTAGTLEVTGVLGDGAYAGTIANGGALIFNQSAAQTLSGAIGGAGTLTKSGGGTLTLSGVNTYGATTVTAGTLSIGSDDNIGSGLNTLDGGTLELNTAGTYSKAWTVAADSAIGNGVAATLGGALSGAGGIEKTGTGTLTLSGANTYAGNTTVSGGTLAVTGTLGGGAYAGTIANAGDLIFDQTADQTLSSAIAGTGNLTKDGTGTLTLSGTNAYSGTTTVSGGVLKLTGALASDVTVQNGATFALGGAITGGLTLASGSALNVAASGTVTGGLSATGATLNLNVPATPGGGAILGVTGAATVSGSTINITSTGTLTDGAKYTLLESSGTSDSLFTGANSYSIHGNALAWNGSDAYMYDVGTGRVRGLFTVALENGDKDLTLTIDAHAALNTTLTWTGNTSGAWENYDAGSPENWSGIDPFDTLGTPSVNLQYLDGDTVIFDDTATGNATVTIDASGVAPANVTVNSARDYVFSGGAITGTASLTKTGTGTLTLTGNNTYSGATTVSGGTLQIGGGGTTGSVTGNIVDNADVTFNRSDAVSYGGVISGTGSLTQQGAGTLTLTGNNTYSGATSVSAGTLSIGSDGNIGSGTNTLNGGTLDLNTTATYTKGWSVAADGAINAGVGVAATFQGVLSGSGGIEKTGTGTLTLTEDNTAHTGGTTVSAGTLSIGSDANIGSGTNTLNGGTLDLNTTATYAKGWSVAADSAINASVAATLEGVLSGPGGIEKTGTGALTLTGNNTYTGDTTVSAGTLAGNIATNTDLTVNSGATYDGSGAARSIDALNGAGTLTSNDNLTVQSGAFGGAITGAAASLTKTGAGTLTLSGNNTYGGGTAVTAGTLSIGSDANIGSGTNTLDGGTLALNTAGAYAKGWIVSANSAINVGGPIVSATRPGINATLSGVLSGAGGIEKTGSGTLTLTGTNTYSGATTVSAGTLAGNIAANTNLTVNTGATYNGSGAARSIGALNGAGTLTSNNSLSVQSGAFGGAITGAAASLTKTGSGTLTLSGNNTYGGGTTVTAGTLSIGSDANIGSGANTLNGGTLALGTAGTYAKDWIVSVDSAIEADINATLSGVLSGAGGIEKTGSGTLTLTGANTYTGGTTVTSGTLIGNIADNTDLTVNTGATYQGTGAARSINALNGAGTVTGTGTLTVQSGSFTGVISGSGSLGKSGPGTLTLGGANTYTGMTIVEAGKLVVTGSGAISDKLTLHSGAEIDIAGAPTFDQLDVHGGATPAIYTGNLSVLGTMNFYIPDTMTSGGTLLRLSGNADNSTVSSVHVGVAGSASPLKTGDEIVLIDAPNNSVPNPIANAGTTATGLHGVTLQYAFDLAEVSTTKLLAILSGPPTVNDFAKALSEGYLAGMTLLTRETDLVVDKGIAAAMHSSPDSAAGMQAFAVFDGGSLRYDTGSRIDVDGFSLLAGLSHGAALASGRLTFGAFYEYGEGNYNTSNSFASGKVKGSGNTEYSGGGLLLRFDANASASGHFHGEATARAGTVKTDFSSADLRSSHGVAANYETDGAYYGVHLGAGYALKLSDRTALDLYGKYLWSRQKGDSLTLNTGDPIVFDDVDSRRLRVGGRLDWNATETLSPYVALAYEHEFDGKARATTYGHAIDAPELKGGTGIGEIGLSFRPGKAATLEAGVQGYAGKRDGATGSLKLKIAF